MSAAVARSSTSHVLATMPPAPTFFHKPVSALNAHRGEVVQESKQPTLTA